jgi:hypothetical protein
MRLTAVIFLKRILCASDLSLKNQIQYTETSPIKQVKDYRVRLKGLHYCSLEKKENDEFFSIFDSL